MRRWIAVLLMMLLLPIKTYAAPETAGKASVLMERSTGRVLYEKNAHEALPPASVTKVMTMLLIMEAVDSGKISLDDTVTASEAASRKGGSQIYLKAGETMPVRDMLKSIAVSSANDCACAMAEHLAGSEAAFVDAMNQRAKELGMQDTHFVNCTGLDDSAEAESHRTSAMDIAIMSRELLDRHPDIRQFTTIWMDTVRGGSFGLSNTNKLIRFYPGATGLKTGFTSTAMYCLSASAQRENMELIAVTMGCPTSKIRMTDCKGMLDYGFANFALAEPTLPEDQTVAVKLGKADEVQAVPEGNAAIVVDKGRKNSITTSISLPEQVEAPVEKGEKLGTVQVLSGEEVLLTVPLVARDTVEAMTYWDVLKNVLFLTSHGSRK